MQSRKFSRGLTVVLAMFSMATLMTGTRAAAQTEKVLHNFSFNSNGKDGNDPQGNLIFDAAGSLYGTTNVGGTGLCGDGAGGIAGCGMVFELTPQVGGGWSEKVLHDFVFDGKTDRTPRAA
jgi:hypothetical protein